MVFDYLDAGGDDEGNEGDGDSDDFGDDYSDDDDIGWVSGVVWVAWGALAPDGAGALQIIDTACASP